MVQIHESCFDVSSWRGKASESGLFEVFRNPTTSREKGLEHGMIPIPPLEKIRDHMGDIINRRTGKTILTQKADAS
jgi:hypothetical protein